MPRPQNAKPAQKSSHGQGSEPPKARQGGEGTGPPPQELNKQSTRTRQEMRTRTNRLKQPYRRPAPEPRVVCAPHRPGGEGGGAYATAAQTRSRHAARTRRTTVRSPRNAQTAWNGVQAGEGKGQPGRTTRNTHRKGRGGGWEPKGRSKNRQRRRRPRTAASAAHTGPGRWRRQATSSTQCYAPAPRLGSLAPAHGDPNGDKPVARARRHRQPGRPRIRGGA